MEINRKLIYKIIQFVCILILGLLLVGIFRLAAIVQGTGQVIKYTGIVSSGTQQLVKLETSGTHKDDLILYLDEIIQELQTGVGQNKLPRINDGIYLEKLSALSTNWEELKKEIDTYRLYPRKEAALIKTSETYFGKSNDVVDAAEDFLNKSIQMMTILAILMGIFLSLVIFLNGQQVYAEIQLSRKNSQRAAGSHLDKLTGLPGATSCDEKIWSTMELKERPYCVVRFNLPNQKYINHTFGEIEGDRLIKDFAGILSHMANVRVFAGRCGGADFMMRIKGHSEEKVIEILNEILVETAVYNDESEALQIHYAVGYEFDGSSLQDMLEKAEEKMNADKLRLKTEKRDV